MFVVFSGFVIEIGLVFIVLCVFNFGIFISMIYCKVGFVVMVGRVRVGEYVDWFLFRNVILVWIVIMLFVGEFFCVVVVLLKEMCIVLIC